MHNSILTRNSISRRQTTRYTIALLLLITLGIGLSCSDNKPTGNDPVGKIPVTVNPISGPPLTSVTVLGLDPTKVDLDSAFALVNGSLSPLFVSDSGAVRLTIPAIVDSVTLWIDTSISSMSLVIINGHTGDTIATGTDVFTLETLLPAPGSVTQMLTDWGTIATSLKTISQALGGAPGVEEQVVSSLLSALDSLINSSDSLSLKSLTARLTAGNPKELALLDALFGSSGVVEQSQGYAMMLATMADSALILGGASSSRNANAVDPTVLTDEQLAYRMQFYVVIREFGRTVLTPTAQAYAIATGAIGVIGNVPIASVITATLTVIDFVVNKFVISTLPAKIDSLRIEVIEDTIFVSEQTNAKIMIYAANDPQAITLNDMVGQILNGLGLTASLTSPSSINAIETLFEDVANYMVGLLQAAVSSYSGSHPELNLDIDLATLPQLRWKAQITNTKFVDLKTHTPSIIKPIPNVVNWVSDVSNTGEGRIYAATTASGATVIPQPAGFAYSAGAFGENVAGAPAISVWAMKKLVMVVDFAPIITAGGSNVLGVTAGHLDTLGVLVPETGIKIDLFTIGGGADPITGLTDTNGKFNSIISLNPLTDTVTVHVTATNTTANTTAKDSVKAAIQLGTSRIAYESWRDGAPGVWSVNPNDTSDIIKYCTIRPSTPSLRNISRLVWSKDSKSLLYSMLSTAGTSLYGVMATASSSQATIFDALRFNVRQPVGKQAWYSSTPSEFLIGAKHRTITSDRGQYICNASGGRRKITGSNWSPSMFISPNDQKVAFRSSSIVNGVVGQAIGVMDLSNLVSGTITKLLHYPAGEDAPPLRLYGWTEDGNSLIFAIGDNVVSPGVSYELRLVDADGLNDRLLSTGPGVLGAPINLPTKNALTFFTSHFSNDIAGPDDHLMVMNLSGGTATRIPLAHLKINSHVTASPDGEFVAFHVNVRPFAIYKVNLTTFEQTLLTSDSLAFTPAWSGLIQ